MRITKTGHISDMRPRLGSNSRHRPVRGLGETRTFVSEIPYQPGKLLLDSWQTDLPVYNRSRRGLGLGLLGDGAALPDGAVDQDANGNYLDASGNIIPYQAGSAGGVAAPSPLLPSLDTNPGVVNSVYAAAPTPISINSTGAQAQDPAVTLAVSSLIAAMNSALADAQAKVSSSSGFWNFLTPQSSIDRWNSVIAQVTNPTSGISWLASNTALVGVDPTFTQQWMSAAKSTVDLLQTVAANAKLQSTWSVLSTALAQTAVQAITLANAAGTAAVGAVKSNWAWLTNPWVIGGSVVAYFVVPKIVVGLATSRPAARLAVKPSEEVRGFGYLERGKRRGHR